MIFERSHSLYGVAVSCLSVRHFTLTMAPVEDRNDQHECLTAILAVIVAIKPVRFVKFLAMPSMLGKRDVVPHIDTNAVRTTD